jgi:hypothetical protein
MSQPKMNAEARKQKKTKSPKRICFPGSSLINNEKAIDTKAAKRVRTRK